MGMTAQEYKDKFCKTKIVSMEDGAEFEIRKLSPIDMWDEAPTTGGKADPSSFMKKVLLNGVVNPPVSIEGGDKDGCINIKDLSLDHFTKLANEILIFSGYRKREEKDKGFLSPEQKE